MLYFLAAIIVLLCAVIGFLSIAYRRVRIGHLLHVKELKSMIAQLAAEKGETESRLDLSDQLQTKLSAARQTIDHDLIDIQHDMARTISENKSAG